ncbi:MAG: 7,8-didemethyl-8-hydroxy-5-deazariboflavin synthase subunit CofH [Cyanobacteria bacterium P01_E01_bin.34]
MARHPRLHLNAPNSSILTSGDRPTSARLNLESCLQEVLDGRELSVNEATALLSVKIPEDIERIRDASDRLRRQLVGETVTYVVNRNINFTNICEQHCSFCAFRRDAGTEGAYWLDRATILDKASDAVQRGATEICMQGGLNPEAIIDGSALHYYVELVEAMKTHLPDLHLHAFSPQEIQFIARQDGLDYATVILKLKQAGVDSMPGTAAEVLVPAVRRVLCPEKLTAQEWIDVVSTAHQLGMSVTCTMLGGHIESMADRAQHFDILRTIQKRSLSEREVAFTEFILLPYVGELAPKKLRNQVGHDQPMLLDSLLTMAVARLFMGRWIPNHQPSWVKLGLDGAATALNWGCNDIGGTLMEEHITSMAGAQGGTGQTVEDLKGAIASVGRPAQQRTTLYQPVVAPISL